MKHALFTVIAGALCATPALAGFEEMPLGLRYSEVREIPGLLAEARGAPVLAGHPRCDTVDSVDLSHQMPPVGNQMPWGSCAAWASGYYHWSHTQWVEDTTRDLSDPRFQCSPSFIYNQINGGADYGSTFELLAAFFAEQGCASLADCPYDTLSFFNWPAESAYLNALPLRAAGAEYIPLYDSSRLEFIKQRLCNGYTTTLGIWVWANFDRIDSFANTYCACERYGVNRGGHLVTIVGYDNNRATSDGPGAFRLANSWGTAWADSGYFWMSYVAALDQALSYRVAFYLNDRIGYRPKLVGRVRLAHNRRDKVGIRLGVGSPDSALWHYDFRWWRSEFIPRPFPDRNLVFDMTEAESLLAGQRTDITFLGCIDDIGEGYVGVIHHFSVEHLDSGRVAVSPDTPESIPDGYEYAYVTTRNPIGIKEATSGERAIMTRLPTIVRGVLRLQPASSHKLQATSLLDATGRMVVELQPGPNDIRHLAPGVYFVRSGPSAVSGEPLVVCKVIVTR